MRYRLSVTFEGEGRWRAVFKIETLPALLDGYVDEGQSKAYKGIFPVSNFWFI
jgi:hypothetical protein